MSFAEWIATSRRPARRASSISLTKTPRSPISPNGLERSRSPAVVMGTMATSASGLAARSRSAASSAWVRASLLPRVPSRIIVSEPEEVPHRVRVEDAVGRRRGLLHAYGRLMQELRHDLARERLDGPSLARRERGEATFRPLQLGLSDGLGLRPKRGDRRHDVERELPGAEAVGLLARDRLRAHGLLATAGDALGDDPLEVVDVIEVAALQVVDRGIEIARDRDVDEEHGPPPPALHRALDLRRREHDTLRARGGDDDVGTVKLLLDGVEPHGATVEAARQSLRPLARAVRDDDLLDAARGEVRRRQVGGLAGSEEEDPAPGQAVEDPFGQLGRRRGHRRGILADRRLRPHALADAQRLPEEPVEDRPRGPGLPGGVVGLAHLAEDLGLARHQGVEAGGDAEEVERGRL